MNLNKIECGGGIPITTQRAADDTDGTKRQQFVEDGADTALAQTTSSNDQTLGGRGILGPTVPPGRGGGQFRILHAVLAAGTAQWDTGVFRCFQTLQLPKKDF